MDFIALKPYSNVPKSKMFSSTNYFSLKNKGSRDTNHTRVLSEGEKSAFKTPEGNNKYKEHDKVSNTAKLDKCDRLEVKSCTKSNFELNGKSINLSDILKTTEFDASEYPNLLDEENISCELVSLSNFDMEACKPMYDQNDSNIVNLNSKKTPNFANRVQSKLPLFNNRNENNSESSENKNSYIFDGKYLDMSLGDIPEEHEETNTISEYCPTGFDKILNYNSNTTTNKYSSNVSNDTPADHTNSISAKSYSRKHRVSEDSRFSTYMNSDNLNKGGLSSELSNSKSQNESSILKPKKVQEDFSLTQNIKIEVFPPNKIDCFMKDKDLLENSENLSLISNSGNKDMSKYCSNREAVKPRRIFGAGF